MHVKFNTIAKSEGKDQAASVVSYVILVVFVQKEVDEDGSSSWRIYFEFHVKVHRLPSYVDIMPLTWCPECKYSRRSTKY